MDPSKFQTDNLYKFMALCGLVLTIACGYANWQLNERASKYRWEEALHDHNLDFLLKKEKEATDPKMKELFSNWFNSEVAKGAHPHHDEADDQKFMAELEPNRSSLKFGIGVGFSLMISGFFLWYYKLQRHLDDAVAQGGKQTAS